MFDGGTKSRKGAALNFNRQKTSAGQGISSQRADLITKVWITLIIPEGSVDKSGLYSLSSLHFHPERSDTLRDNTRASAVTGREDGRG